MIHFSKLLFIYQTKFAFLIWHFLKKMKIEFFQPFVNPVDHFGRYLLDFRLVPNIVPHLFVKQNVFVLFAQGTLLKQLKGNNGINYFIWTALNDQKRAIVILESGWASTHFFQQKIHCGKTCSAFVGIKILFYKFGYSRIAITVVVKGRSQFGLLR